MEENMEQQNGQTESSMPSGPKEQATMPSADGNNKIPMLFALIGLITLIVVAVGAYLFLNQDNLDLSDPEQLEEYMKDAGDKLVEYDGVVTFEVSDSTQSAIIRLDFVDEGFYAKNLVPGVAEAYLLDDMAYIDIDGTWYSGGSEVFNMDFEDLAATYNFANSIDIDTLDFDKETDCPNIDGTCYLINDSSDDSLNYFEKSTGRIVFVEGGGLEYEITYEPGDIVVPDAIKEEAIDYEGAASEGTVEDFSF